jgi:pretoxin HINT domain-containing protein/thrombospondin type 3 repeat protein
MSARRGTVGQASAELLGMLLIISTIVGALLTLGIGGTVASATKSAVCSILSGQCESAPPAGDRASAGASGDDDGDGVSDADERERGTDPDTADTDGDGLPDGQERTLGTHPGIQDTDSDGIPDAEEADSDGKLDPTSADTDGDGLTDPEEIAVGTDPNDADSDGAGGAPGDGLTDKEEIDRGTDPTAYDSDGDFQPDGAEVDNGDDPLKDERSLPEKALDGLLDDPFGLGKGTIIKKGPKKLVDDLINKGGKKGGGRFDEIEDLGDRARARRERLEALRKGQKTKVDDVLEEACSFAGGTLVLMADGSRRPIAQLRAGDRVIATDPDTGRRSARPVTRVWVHDDRLLPLAVGGEVLLTTAEHPFWGDGGWEPAGELRAGDRVGIGRRRSLAVTPYAGVGTRGTAYNLTVAGVHTFHVGRTEALVHNTCLPVLRNFRTKRVQVGDTTFQLDKKGMNHILTRHHPRYWDGSAKKDQSFFDPKTTLDDIDNLVSRVVTANRDELMRIGAGRGQVRAVIDGQEYVLGVSRGRIAQFYPRKR